jgi:signal peptidase II
VPDPARGTQQAWLQLALVAGVVIVLDQVSKELLRSSLALGASTTVIPGLLRIIRTTNSGVAFSALSGSVVLVTALALVVMALLLAFFARFGLAQRLVSIPTGMVVGGALGNLVDRLRLGAVTDFIKLPHFPAFNLADSAITVGVIALVLMIGRRGAEGST